MRRGLAKQVSEISTLAKTNEPSARGARTRTGLGARGSVDGGKTAGVGAASLRRGSRTGQRATSSRASPTSTRASPARGLTTRRSGRGGGVLGTAFTLGLPLALTLRLRVIGILIPIGIGPLISRRALRLRGGGGRLSSRGRQGQGGSGWWRNGIDGRIGRGGERRDRGNWATSRGGRGRGRSNGRRTANKNKRIGIINGLSRARDAGGGGRADGVKTQRGSARGATKMRAPNSRGRTDGCNNPFESVHLRTTLVTVGTLGIGELREGLGDAGLVAAELLNHGSMPRVLVGGRRSATADGRKRRGEDGGLLGRGRGALITQNGLGGRVRRTYRIGIDAGTSKHAPKLFRRGGELSRELGTGGLDIGALLDGLGRDMLAIGGNSLNLLPLAAELRVGGVDVRFLVASSTGVAAGLTGRAGPGSACVSPGIQKLVATLGARIDEFLTIRELVLAGISLHDKIAQEATRARGRGGQGSAGGGRHFFLSFKKKKKEETGGGAGADGTVAGA